MVDRLFTALLHVVPTECGGRKMPFKNGYRPQFHVAQALCSTSFMIQKIDNGEEMRPGETGTVQAFLLSPDGLGVPVDEGTEFELREGHTVVATGVFRNIYDHNKPHHGRA
jgi:translation elongation factor EF-Tu-like GTPase